MRHLPFWCFLAATAAVAACSQSSGDVARSVGSALDGDDDGSGGDDSDDGVPHDSTFSDDTHGLPQDDGPNDNADFCAQVHAGGGGAHDPMMADQVCQGEKKFVKPLVHGNGRSCATCHVPEDDYLLRPASVQARFDALPRDPGPGGTEVIDYSADPLFNSIDANDGADDFTNLKKGLVKITLPIPPNITIDQLPGATTITVWRKTPTIRDVAIRAPYQLDGREPTLQLQALGAAIDHSQVTKLPSQRTLDLIAAFELAQFSNDRAADVAAALAAGTPAPSPFPSDLNEQEQRGLAVFNAKCVDCHFGPTTAGFSGRPLRATQKFHNIMSSATKTRNAAGLPTYTIRCRNPNGSILVRSGRPDPGRALITGVCNDISKFESRTLFDVKNHAPYLHDASAQTLEDVLAVYNNFFFKLPPTLQAFGGPLTPQQTADVIAFLKRL